MGKKNTDTKDSVQQYYDLKGWQRVRGEVFEDAERFEDLRSVANTYRQKCHLRINRYLKPGGKFLLDVASGPIQYPEYLSYHQEYQYRICGDISFQALVEAKKVLSDDGFCVQCDITRLPFTEGAVSGFVSLHTIYHVPAKEQVNAFAELYRVLEPGKNGVVVYSWASHSTFSIIFGGFLKSERFFRRVAAGVYRRIKRLFRPSPKVSAQQSPKYEKLYFHAHPYQWVVEKVGSQIPIKIHVWRSVSVKMTRAFIRPWLLGRIWLAILYRLEERYPRWFGKHGVYPLIWIKK